MTCSDGPIGPVFLSMKDDSQSRGYSNLCFIRVNLWLVLFCHES